MKMNVYSIFDSAAGAYMRPFYCQADGQAIRMFSDIANDDNHDVGKHPKDYTLVRIGSYNDKDAKLSPEPVESLVTALEIRSQARNGQSPQAHTPLVSDVAQPQWSDEFKAGEAAKDYVNGDKSNA